MKIAAVPYLNALPLIHFLPERPRLEPPAVLDRLLKTGEIDLATAPIITLLENPEFGIVPGVGIGTKGAVGSVRLCFRRDGLTIRDLSTIHLDSESITSISLLKVLLHFKHRCDLGKIRFSHGTPAPDADAVLLIGDKALRENGKSIDLGSEWTRWTRLPFLFAGWISRLPRLDSSVITKLQDARDRAIADLSAIAPETGDLSKDLVERYLRENISYDLGTPELEGLKRFRGHLFELGLIKLPFRPRFY